MHAQHRGVCLLGLALAGLPELSSIAALYNASGVLFSGVLSAALAGKPYTLFLPNDAAVLLYLQSANSTVEAALAGVLAAPLSLARLLSPHVLLERCLPAANLTTDLQLSMGLHLPERSGDRGESGSGNI
ncbi:hypothetical protein TSOC_007196 [Tetrabaena socialis]|uniref:FAS1 domain-containing protein n=1 Tax=Tetrabaena socialis TaxID=47790 RepID=A0A2J8A1L6_9CHLO|nr:hypothetical protein TSOC_007196 [Tetrabaena socialis]|eukprot:PNH06419.1 hypothetical protein TSOC_007196 [Tetrabaena socialis]